MSTITIPIPDETLSVLESWTREQGITVEQYLSSAATDLSRHLSAPLHPTVIRATGIIRSDIDPEKEHLDHLARKHA